MTVPQWVLLVCTCMLAYIVNDGANQRGTTIAAWFTSPEGETFRVLVFVGLLLASLPISMFISDYIKDLKQRNRKKLAAAAPAIPQAEAKIVQSRKTSSEQFAAHTDPVPRSGFASVENKDTRR